MVNTLQLIQSGFSYATSAYKQLRFIKKFLYPIVEQCLQDTGYQLSLKEKQKVAFYYPLFNHIVNAENYLHIKNRRLSEAESKRLAIVSVMATLYDDLIDEDRLSQEQLLDILHRRNEEQFTSLKIQMIFALDNQLKKIWNPTTAYLQALELAIHWQLVSLEQLNANIDLSRILFISKEKCGNSSLLWASLLDENFTIEDKAFIFQSGYIGQMVNDLFDVHKDVQDGVFTFVRKCLTIADAKQIFIEECRKLNQLILACEAAEDLKRKTINRIAAIHSFAFVSLQHLQTTENKFSLPLNWLSLHRKDLITDMALLRNKLALLNHAIFLAKLN